jgi:eukaryotic-like serine/threonine-protein kinase
MTDLPDLERWRRLDRLFAEALDRDPPEREGFLRQACGGDAALFRDASSLLECAVEAERVLGGSAAAVAEALLDSLAAEVAQTSPSGNPPPDGTTPGPRTAEPASKGGLAASKSGLAGSKGGFAAEPPPARQLGPYRILDELGRGGMGIVFRARDLRLERLVAIKFLPRSLTGGDEARRRLLAEARAVSAIEHPNVASLYEIGEAPDGRTYLVFAHYEGETLKERIARGPLPEGEVVRWARQIAAGLAAAHRRGVTHRDIKPANVILTREGWAKILDFGVAKVAGSDPAAPGTRVGTVGYMSPEQIRGEGVDARSDLWSLGVVLHEMLTGENPFRGEGPAEIARRIVGRAPLAPEVRHRAIPDSLLPVLARLLARRPGDRYPDATALVAAFEALEKGGEGLSGSAPVGGVVPAAAEPRTGADAAPPAPRPHPLPGHGPLPGRRGRPVPRPAALLLAIAAAALLAGAWLLREAGPVGPGALPPASVAVLPFTELGDGSVGSWFGDGIAEDVLDALSRIPELRVISSSSAMQYRDRDRPLAEIAEELGVSHVVEGSVRRAGGGVRISVRLVDARVDRRLWSETYDRDLTDIFRIQSDIARRVASALEATLSPLEDRRLDVPPTESLEAYDLLLQATDYLRRYRREDNEVAIVLFERALEADPTFALAHARRAAALALKDFQYGDGHQWGDSALAGALRAAELDPELSEAHHALGLAHLAGERYDRAVEAFERAAELNPGYWATVNTLGVVSWRRGDYDEAIRWYRQAMALDPAGYASTLSTISGAYALLGFFDEAGEAVARALDLEPALPLAHMNALLLHLVAERDEDAVRHGALLTTTSPGNARAWASAGTALQFGGETEAARMHFERALELSPTSFDLLWRSSRVLLAHALVAAGEVERADGLLEEFRAFALDRIAGGNEGPFLRYNLAGLHAIRGERDEAFGWLAEAVARGKKEHLFLARDPLLESLRGDPRFAEILARNRAEMERQRAGVDAAAEGTRRASQPGP